MSSWKLYPRPCDARPILLNRVGHGDGPTSDETVRWHEPHSSDGYLARCGNLLISGDGGRVDQIDMHPSDEAARTAFASFVEQIRGYGWKPEVL